MSRVLLTLAGGVEPDTFTVAEVSGPLPDEGADVIVPLARFLAEKSALLARAGRLGVELAPEDDALALEGHLDGVALVALRFPSYQDGRGYTHARRLREQLSFDGEVRAVGDIGADHLFNLRRCGCDAFVLREGEDEERARRALTRFTVATQPAAWSP